MALWLWEVILLRSLKGDTVGMGKTSLFRAKEAGYGTVCSVKNKMRRLWSHQWSPYNMVIVLLSKSKPSNVKNDWISSAGQQWTKTTGMQLHYKQNIKPFGIYLKEAQHLWKNLDFHVQNELFVDFWLSHFISSYSTRTTVRRIGFILTTSWLKIIAKMVHKSVVCRFCCLLQCY